MEIPICSIERLCTVFDPARGAEPVLLLGAGASVKSGIPLSAEVVERAARWAYCREHARDPADPFITRSDWLPWLHALAWYRADLPPGENYSATVEHLLQPREERREFFLQLLRPQVPISAGYEALTRIVAARAVRTILTTNFDSLVVDAVRASRSTHYIEVLKSSAEYIRLSTSPQYPQLVYLHGAVEDYSDKNLLDEVQTLDSGLVTALVPILRDHPLVVVGYRGAEPSVMRALLGANVQAAFGFRHGIYWCEYSEGGAPSKVHSLVEELASQCGGNLQVVPISGFDELMTKLASVAVRRAERTQPVDQSERGPDPGGDLQRLPACFADQLDWPLVESRLGEYCRSMHLAVPRTREEWIRRLCSSDLAAAVGGQVVLTRAGALLFGATSGSNGPSRPVRIDVQGERPQFVTGSLWRQLETIMRVLSDVNAPFRLKGEQSDEVAPYPPLALKELVVNALVHRDYTSAEETRISIGPDSVAITNPGGLVEEVLKRVSGSALQERIELGERGLRGYRNPVLADIFYGAGAMDKAGSGLSDAQRLARENGGSLSFGPSTDNAHFEAVLGARGERYDHLTRTAVPRAGASRYVSNLLEITSLPHVVYFGVPNAARVRDVWRILEPDDPAPFIVHSKRLFTLSNLDDPENPLRRAISANSISSLTMESFSHGPDGERLLVYLLNECLYRKLNRTGLVVDKVRKRAYYPRAPEGPREVAYKATVRRATRTVAKPVISKTTQKVRHWEHESFQFSFEKYASAWALQIVPGYVFTMDGATRLMPPDRVGPLATRRSAHDYNLQVYNDLVFWTWVLAEGGTSIELFSEGDISVVAKSSLEQVLGPAEPIVDMNGAA